MFDLTVIVPSLRKPSCIALSIYLVLYTIYYNVYICVCSYRKRKTLSGKGRARKEEIARDKAEHRAQGGKLSTKLGVDGYNPSAPQGTYGVACPRPCYCAPHLRTDGVNCRESADTGPVFLKVVPVTDASILQVTMDQLVCAYIFPHPILDMKWAC